jgi:PAS domain S-box-containing protein
MSNSDEAMLAGSAGIGRPDPDPAPVRHAPVGTADAQHDHAINQRIFETSLDLILVADSRGNFIRVSPSSQSILGFDPEEMVGHLATEFLCSEDLDATRSEMRLARYGQTTRNFECRYIHKQGRLVTLWWTGVWSDPEHQYFFIGRDITEQKRALEALRHSEEQLRRGQRLAQIGSNSTDLRTGRIEWSDETFSIFGVSRETFVPSTEAIMDMIHPDDRERVWARIGQVRQGVSPEPIEYRIVRPDGSTRHVYRESEIVKRDESDPGNLLSIIQDVTDRRRTEDQLRQSQKMEAIGNLTGGLAHDFNNMLGVIIGNLDLARDLLGENHAATELVREAIEAAASSAELTRRLLAFARRQPLRPERIALSELVADFVRLLRRTLGENIEIALDLADDVWPVVADPIQLEAALTNLATNARDAMPRGGKLSITTVNRQLDADYAAAHAEVTPGDYAAIEITDTGSGMPPEVAEHIFEPFFTTKEQGRGTGLGLSMVFGFIKQSGGHINVYSEPGVGTTFRLYLPRTAIEASAAGTSPTAASPEGAGETVLAVEDNPRLRRLVIRQLSQLGYRPLAADGPAAALTILENEKVDVLFTDVVMPGPIDGIALAQQAIERWPALRVVFTSGFPGTNLDDQLGPRASGMRLLSKPYRKEDLASLLSEMLR